jgi:hypothetical protein
LNKK